MSRFVLVDGNAIIHRAYHAIPPLTTREGTMVNAVYGFTSMLLKVWRELKPDCLAVAFDVAGGTFRHQASSAYKATRVKADQELYDQIPLVHEVVSVFGIPIYEKPGYEADDVIGTIARQCRAESNPPEVYIVTGDMDTLQLVEPGVKVYTLRKGMSDVVVYDEDKVKERFGFPPKRLVEYKALAGDASDNISGVPGIGEKTALALVQTFGTIEHLYKEIKKIGTEQAVIKPAALKKLLAGEEQARMSKFLATIDTKVPDLNFSVAACRIAPLNRDVIISLFQRLEFSSLLARLPELGAVPGGESHSQSKKEAKKTDTPRLKGFAVIESAVAVQDLEKRVKNLGGWQVRPLISGKEFPGARLAGLVAVAGAEVWHIPEQYVGGCARLFADPGVELSGHDLKQLVKALSSKDIQVSNRLFDSMVAAYLLRPGNRTYDPASIILKALGRSYLPAAPGQESLFGQDVGTLAIEAELLAETAAVLKKELEEINNLGLLEKIEAPLIPVLAGMELAGVAIDRGRLAALSRRIAEEIREVTKTIYALSGTEFNIASPIQLREVLFEKMQLPVQGVKKGKTGLSTSAEELEKLRDLHPIIDHISNYRELCKLQNTYVDVLPTLVNETTGRIHTHFNQTIAATGRLSSSDPNLQNIPVRTELGREIRKTFVAASGRVLLSADYSQIELRIVASLAEDEKMLEIFSRDEDIHRATAAAINGVTPSEVTKEMRYAAKEINFGVLYGMGTYGLAWRARIPQWQAKQFITKYFAEFLGVKKYIDQTLEFTKKEGYCETLFGRRRYIPELTSSNYQLRSAAERMAINHPIQGTAADLMKLAMIEVQAKLDPGLATLILQVHDELVLEVKRGYENEVAKLIKQTMENVVQLRVPVKVDVKIGENWGEMK